VSNWVYATSGVPQWSVLGPTLFAAYVNDLPRQLSNVSKLYADDLKIIAKFDSKENVLGLQSDLDTVSEWCRIWLMNHNTKKCGVMNIGRNKEVGSIRSYTLLNSEGNRVTIRPTKEERDFKFGAQAAHAASKANRILGMLKRTFLSRDVELWTSLYRTYIRPQLEFAVSAWNLYRRRDVACLEKVQRRVTRLPTSLRGVQYEERLARMGLTTLETICVRGDLIELFKIVRGEDDISWHNELMWSQPRESKRCKLRREIVSS
jgi:ribonuclease P/MRP protein subunit RPP40